ncbi:gastrin-releasing peptide isoform X2 [Vulpes vulpes]|uniref:Gastrin-releasing peptide n=1 Tax=Vulpes vulpes TaxID=9627 RepID=A0A3Q7S3S1_VULVU
MDDFRGLLSQRPGSLRGDVRALGAAGEEPPGPTPARAAYKVGASRRCGGTGGAPRSGSSRPRSEGRARSAGLRAPALPARTMRGRELPLVLLALVLCQAPRGPAAPVPGGQGTVLDKMYPRGNHWAVGHLMGKKSTRESPYVYEEGSLKQQLQGYIRWEEAARNLLSLMEAKGTRSHQTPQREPLGIRQSAWDYQDDSNFKELADSLLQVLNLREETPR